MAPRILDLGIRWR